MWANSSSRNGDKSRARCRTALRPVPPRFGLGGGALVKLVRLENQRPGGRFDRLYRYNLAACKPNRLLVWTVNNRRGIRRVGRSRPDLVLTDLHFDKFMPILAASRRLPESGHRPARNSACVYLPGRSPVE